jgi:hypothetical protein
MAWHMAGLLLDFGHPDDIAGSIEAIQRRRLSVQLVAKYDHKFAHCHSMVDAEARQRASLL